MRIGEQLEEIIIAMHAAFGPEDWVVRVRPTSATSYAFNARVRRGDKVWDHQWAATASQTRSAAAWRLRVVRDVNELKREVERG